MTTINPIARLRGRVLPWASGPLFVFAWALTTVVATGVMLDRSVSRDLFSPAISTLLFVLAAAVALIAWRWPAQGPHLSYWDVAGGLTLIGLCVAATVEPEQMVRLVAGTDRSP